MCVQWHEITTTWGTINQSINQSIKQSINQSINRSRYIVAPATRKHLVHRRESKVKQIDDFINRNGQVLPTAISVHHSLRRNKHNRR